MIDLKLLRENPEKFIKLIASGRGNSGKSDINKWLELDKQRGSLIRSLENLNAERNSVAAMGKQDPEAAREKGKELKEKIANVEKDLKAVEAQWQEILDWIPNMPYSDVPEGLTSSQNVEVKAWKPVEGYLDAENLGLAEQSGKKMGNMGVHRDSDFIPKPHWEIGENLGLFDLDAGAKVSGSRFYYIKGYGALLIYAAFNLLYKKLLQEGFTPMIVPLLVKENALYGSSHFPGDADQVYKLENKYLEDNANDLYLIGSSEPANFAYFSGKTLNLNELPVKVMAQTPCFRSEVGSWGKDVRGIKRTHQFEKIEMNLIIPANDTLAYELHEYLLGINEWLLQTLEIPYHVINMCVGDLGYFAAAKKYDVEFWTPSQNCYTELMSNSITTDYQSRRLGIKYKDENGKLKFAYTLNDTGITHRILIAILEHYQQSDGSLVVPEALRSFVGKDIIKK